MFLTVKWMLVFTFGAISVGYILGMLSMIKKKIAYAQQYKAYKSEYNKLTIQIKEYQEKFDDAFREGYKLGYARRFDNLGK